MFQVAGIANNLLYILHLRSSLVYCFQVCWFASCYSG